MRKILSKLFSLATLRILLGFIFLWAFLDKTFGLGFATKSTGAWINGGSPTAGFLTHGTQGPFASFFQGLAGVPMVDWLFMLGLLFIGVTLLAKRFLKWGAFAGIVMMALMYLAALWPANNPLIDEHIIYLFLLGYIAFRAE